MAQSRAAIGAKRTPSRAVPGPARAESRRIRFIVVFSVVLICGSFAAAAAIQMRNDRMRAIAEATYFDEQRAREISIDLAAALNRFVAVGASFANTSTTAETAAALSEAGGTALRNIAVLDGNGTLQSELTSTPKTFLPLSPETLQDAYTTPAVVSSRDGKGFAIVFRAGVHIVAVELDAKALMPSASDEDALLTTLSGQVVALGAQWKTLPEAGALALGNWDRASRIVDTADGRRLIALRRVQGWPLAVGASSRVGQALDAWYGALPLYFFFIVGPALAGAGLAVVFVREFERRARTAQAMRTLRSAKPGEARLLVRLADAERRAMEAERAQRSFMSHMSHELRTPLNAIIGFSEVIERGVFGIHEKYGEYASDIKNAGRELHDKIVDILDFADLRANQRPLPQSPVDIVAVLRRLVDEIAPRAHARGIRLIVTLPVAAIALADPLALRRICGHILANALQYSTRGSSVRVQIKTDDDSVAVCVQDQGLGFTPGELERAGQPFRRFDRPGSKTGTGLGLAIALNLARRMDANLNLSSRHGEGTLAELRLRKPTDTTRIPPR